jgi:CRP-like cAMP-binding protein
VPRTATVTARTTSRLYALGKARFLASVGSHPRATREADRLVRERLPAPQATIAP